MDTLPQQPGSLRAPQQALGVAQDREDTGLDFFFSFFRFHSFIHFIFAFFLISLSFFDSSWDCGVAFSRSLYLYPSIPYLLCLSIALFSRLLKLLNYICLHLHPSIFSSVVLRLRLLRSIQVLASRQCLSFSRVLRLLSVLSRIRASTPYIYICICLCGYLCITFGFRLSRCLLLILFLRLFPSLSHVFTTFLYISLSCTLVTTKGLLINQRTDGLAS